MQKNKHISIVPQHDFGPCFVDIVKQVKIPSGAFYLITVDSIYFHFRHIIKKLQFCVRRML